MSQDQQLLATAPTEIWPPEDLGPMGWLLTHQAARDPDRPAITFEGETLSRGQLDRAANRMARALAGLGVEQDQITPLVAPSTPAHQIFAFALWKLGATPLPISHRLPEAELRGILELVSPRLVIGPAPGSLAGYRTVAHGFKPPNGLSDDPLPPKIARHWKGMTSGGSTGRPKVIVDAGASVASPSQPLPLLKLVADDVILHAAPMYHNSFFAQVSWALCAGAHVVEMAKFEPVEWLALIERHKVRWAYLVPTMMHRIWSLPADVREGFDLSSLQVAMHMAAPCPAWLKQAWIDWLGAGRVWEIFGATESVGGALISGPEWLEHRGSVGRPTLPVRILDEDGRDLPIGEVGEIYFPAREGADSGFSYIGAERRIRDGWETLGDMGSLDADGYLYPADRRADMIISGGANIYPAEIEGALDAHPSVASSAVVGLPDPDWGRRPHAIIQLRPGAPAPEGADLEAFLDQKIARYKLPATYEISPVSLRDDAGKMRRASLRNEREARLAQGERFLPLTRRAR